MTFYLIYFSFTGRINRRTFWFCSLMMMLIRLAIFTICLVTEFVLRNVVLESNVNYLREFYTIVRVLNFIFSIFMLWPWLSVHVKRWHDLNRSGFWALIGFIPVIGGIVELAIAGFLEGTDGPNPYGEIALE